MGSLRLCMAAMVGRVTFLRVLVEAPSGEWEECRMVVGCVGLCAACWTLGRFRQDLLRATAQAGEAAEQVNGIIVVAALDNKARDMFALYPGNADGGLCGFDCGCFEW